MPGHIKLKKGQTDPDPTEYLLPSIECKREDQQKGPVRIWYRMFIGKSYNKFLIPQHCFRSAGLLLLVLLGSGRRVRNLGTGRFTRCVMVSCHLYILNSGPGEHNILKNIIFTLIHTEGLKNSGDRMIMIGGVVSFFPWHLNMSTWPKVTLAIAMHFGTIFVI